MAAPVAVELDQAIGVSGGVPGGLVSIGASDKFAYASGGVVCVASCTHTSEQHFLRGHTDNVTALAVSRSGSLLATGQQDDADVLVWDMASNTVRARLEEHDMCVCVCAFSDDERLLLTVGADDAMIIWDLATGNIVARHKHEPRPTCTAVFGGFVRDIKHRDTGLYQFATGGKGHVHLWALNPLDGRMANDRIAAPGLSRDYLCLAFSPLDGAPWLYAGTSSGEVVVISVRSRAVHTNVFASGGGVCSIVALPALTEAERASGWLTIVAGSGDGRLFFYKHAAAPQDSDPILLTSRASSRLGGGGGATGASSTFLPYTSVKLPESAPIWGLSPSLMSATPVAPLLACTAAGSIFRITLDTTSGAAPSSSAGAPSRSIRNVSQWSAGDGSAAERGADSAVPAAVTLLRQAHAAAGETAHGLPDWAALSVPATALTGHGSVSSSTTMPGLPAALAASRGVCDVTGIAFAAGISDRFATCATDNTVRVWDAGEYTCIQSVTVRGAGHPTCIVLAAEYHISGWQDGAIRAYLVRPSTASSAPAPASGRRSVASTDDGALWTVPDAHPLREGGVTALALANNQRFVVSGGANGSIRLWDMRSRALVTQFREHAGPITGLLLYPSDTHLLSVSKDRSMMGWDLRAERRISVHTQRMGGMHAVALTRDGSMAITSSQDRRVAFWDLRQTAPVTSWSPVHGHDGEGEATCLAVARTRDILATGGTDARVKLWSLTTGALISECVGHSGCLRALAFSPDDRQLVSVGTDGGIFVWNVYA